MVEERWRGLPWAAEPHWVVVSDPELLVTWMPAGTVAVRASNRDLPGTKRLTRDQRKLKALEDCQAVPIETVETPNKLHVWRPGRWSRVNLGWHPTSGIFMGWYVNFEQPIAATVTGVWGKDLVVDLLISPDGTHTVKDAADFEEAIIRGILPSELRDFFAIETGQVLAELAERSGPFASDWRQFRPGPGWETPLLPPTHRLGGEFCERLAAGRSAPAVEWSLPVTTRRTMARAVTVGDVNALAGLAADDRVRKFLGGARPPQVAREKAMGRVAAAPPGDLVVEDRITTEVIGHIELEQHGDRWDLSYEFVPAVWGLGLTREAIGAVLQRLAEHHPAATVVAETQVVNQRSRRLLDSLGFAQIDRYERKGAEQLLLGRGGDPGSPAIVARRETASEGEELAITDFLTDPDRDSVLRFLTDWVIGDDDAAVEHLADHTIGA